MSASVMRLAAAMCSGFGRVFGTFGARTAASAPTLPLPFRLQKTRERTHPGQRPHQRPAAMPSARRAAMKARTSCGASLRQFAQRRPAAQMVGQETPGIGGRRVRRPRQSCPTSAARAEMREPARHLGRDVPGGKRQFRFVGLGRTTRLSHPFVHRSLSAVKPQYGYRFKGSGIPSRSGVRAAFSTIARKL